jgi:para-nitrobenzyl esterase
VGATIRVATGELSGTSEQGVRAFKGIPYAAPPVGPRRLRPPQPAAEWSGVRDASRYGAVALQRPMPGIFGELGTPQNPAGDDCLNLNGVRLC